MTLSCNRTRTQVAQGSPFRCLATASCRCILFPMELRDPSVRFKILFVSWHCLESVGQFPKICKYMQSQNHMTRCTRRFSIVLSVLWIAFQSIIGKMRVHPTDLGNQQTLVSEAPNPSYNLLENQIDPHRVPSSLQSPRSNQHDSNDYNQIPMDQLCPSASLSYVFCYFTIRSSNKQNKEYHESLQWT